MPLSRTKLLPLPFSQVAPLLTLYCQAAPGSNPPTRMVPSVLMPSPTAPVSFSRITRGARALVSTARV